jgi:hypothetical protein
MMMLLLLLIQLPVLETVLYGTQMQSLCIYGTFFPVAGQRRVP